MSVEFSIGVPFAEKGWRLTVEESGGSGSPRMVSSRREPIGEVELLRVDNTADARQFLAETALQGVVAAEKSEE